MAKKKKLKVEHKVTTLKDWLTKLGNFSPLTIRILDGNVMLQHIETNEIYLIHVEEKKNAKRSG